MKMLPQVYRIEGFKLDYIEVGWRGCRGLLMKLLELLGWIKPIGIINQYHQSYVIKLSRIVLQGDCFN